MNESSVTELLVFLLGYITKIATFFVARLFKECGNVKNPSEYKKYFLCSVVAITGYSTHRLVAKHDEVVLGNTAVIKHVQYCSCNYTTKA